MFLVFIFFVKRIFINLGVKFGIYRVIKEKIENIYLF